MFGSKDAIAAEKCSLFRHLEKGGVAVMNGSQPYVEDWTKNVVPQGVKVVTFAQKPQSDVHTQGAVTADERGLHFTLDAGQAVSLPMLGQHNVDNALAAFAVTRAFGIDDAAAAKALAASTGVEMRMQVSRIRTDEAGAPGAGITLINDAYNANPDSTVSALSTLASLPAKNFTRRIAILGDMLELGDESEYEHRHIGDMLCVFNGLPPKPPGPAIAAADRAGNTPTKINLAILIGPHMKHAVEQLARVWPPENYIHFDRWSDDLPSKIAAMLREGDLVLLKASRGLRFERIVPAIEKRFHNAEHEVNHR
jgi:UDP-N-acetylmuramoyl-tripeptide--D-alanyl-D-alanine ligase